MKIHPAQLSKNYVYIWSLGKLGYEPALHLQQLLVNRHLKGIKLQEHNNNVLLLVEHDPVYTVGIRTSEYPESEELRLKALGAEFYKTNRGGLITYHGPGQLVAYPILNLSLFTKSMKWYVCRLEETVIQMCKQSFGIQAGRSSNTGVWVGDNKISALGVHGSRYITSHGLALNCDVNLDWYSHVTPCGIADKGVTSLTQELGRQVTIREAVPHLLNSFSHRFSCDLQPLASSVREEIVDALSRENRIKNKTGEKLILGNTWVEDW